MDIKTSLYISYAAIGVSLCTLAFSILAAIVGLHIPTGPGRVVQVVSLIWPLAFYAAAVYRRKIAQDQAKKASGG